MKNKLTRQAISIARIRQDRRAKNLCVECAAPAARKKLAGGKIKILTRCPAHLAAAAAPRYWENKFRSIR